MTRQRAAILAVIRSDKGHRTAEEIFALSKQILPSISRATVYNNLKTLEKQQLIRKISGEGACDIYDSSFVPHGHLFCGCCGGIYDFSIEGFEEILSDAIGSDACAYELKVKGICPDCRAKAGTD